MDEILKLGARFFQEQSGREPVREWLKSLSLEDKKSIGADIRLVQLSWPIGLPLVRSLGGGLWEVRSTLENRIARVIFSIENHEMLLLHGFIKKTQKTTNQDLNLAKIRKKKFDTIE